MKKANLWGEEYNTLRQLPNKPFGRDAALEIVFAERTLRHFFFNIYKLLFPSKSTPRITEKEGCTPSTALNFAEERWKDVVDYTDRHRDLQALINNDSMDLPWYTLDTWEGIDDAEEDSTNRNEDNGEDDEEEEEEEEEEQAGGKEKAKTKAKAKEKEKEEFSAHWGSSAAKQKSTPSSGIIEAFVLLDTWDTIREWDPWAPFNEVMAAKKATLLIVPEAFKEAIEGVIECYVDRIRAKSLKGDQEKRKTLTLLARRMRVVDPQKYAYFMEENVRT
ncbi:hypothetical protein FRB94_009515 [Tulasnella sp. JGI-2019a]|nr:hypothetical protein FRB94_009515 [Tulasnella sp. JGI-2019a]KAG9007944.1 hypothetical protein FRB93_006963 [Tulasnella sp. JGI-2019a]